MHPQDWKAQVIDLVAKKNLGEKQTSDCYRSYNNKFRANPIGQVV
jgi:hypothetical protein